MVGADVVAVAEVATEIGAVAGSDTDCTGIRAFLGSGMVLSRAAATTATGDEVSTGTAVGVIATDRRSEENWSFGPTAKAPAAMGPKVIPATTNKTDSSVPTQLP